MKILPFVMKMLLRYPIHCHEEAVMSHYSYSLSWRYSPLSWRCYHTTPSIVMKMSSQLFWICCKATLFIVMKILPFVMNMLSHYTTCCHEDALWPPIHCHEDTPFCHEDAITLHYLLSWRCSMATCSLSWRFSPLSWRSYQVTLANVMKIVVTWHNLLSQRGTTFFLSL